MRVSKLFLISELLGIYIGVPLILLFTNAPRGVMHGCLWLLMLYCLIAMHKQSGLSWKKLWHGRGWVPAQRNRAALRFIALVPVLAAITWYVVPERLLAFPTERPWFWALVMLLYPLLSVIPQEIVLRSFFFERYEKLFLKPLTLVAVNALLFGFAHIMFNNWIAPTFCVVGGAMFASSYQQHRSLKWVTIEHALYGCALFTLGLGWFFFKRIG